ncbi:hypothetical protein [Paraglaciecola sp.]|uniref:hypothetical protein n=1 Tax=Paraglaciecola sp. TaxID=1920173 RepID=UPI0032647949
MKLSSTGGKLKPPPLISLPACQSSATSKPDLYAMPSPATNNIAIVSSTIAIAISLYLIAFFSSRLRL